MSYGKGLQVPSANRPNLPVFVYVSYEKTLNMFSFRGILFNMFVGHTCQACGIWFSVFEILKRETPHFYGIFASSLISPQNRSHLMTPTDGL